jgi:hypothetical protein
MGKFATAALAGVTPTLSKPPCTLIVEDVSRIEPPMTARYARTRDRDAREHAMIASESNQWHLVARIMEMPPLG